MEFSRIMLGTVQFGMNYGIANSNGRPDYKTCLEITAAALESGINCFDTAAAYGESEQVLGRALAELNTAGKVVLVSKSRPVSEAELSADEVEGFIEESLRQSLRNLSIEVLPVFLLHRDADLVWMEALHRMKEKGLVRHIGISVDTAEGAKRAVAHGLTEAVQLPHNLFDRRFSSGSLFSRVGEREIKLFTRSAFLQGLLLMPEEKIPASLSEVIPVRRKLEALARKAGMGMPELCLRYSLSFPEITSVLIGVDTVEQMRENAAIMQRGPLDEPLLELIYECVPDFSETIVRPSCWGIKNENKPSASETENNPSGHDRLHVRKRPSVFLERPVQRV